MIIEEEAQGQIEKWKKFAKERLIPDLEAQRKVVDQLEKDIENYSNLSRWAAGIVTATSSSAKSGSTPASSSSSSSSSSSKEVLVDLGLGYYSPAEMCNMKDAKILVAVGLGFQLEMTLAEAAMFADQKVLALRKEHDIAVKTLAGISSTLATIVYGISQLN